jgi:hypothetical protein
MHVHMNVQFVTMHGHVNVQFVTIHGHMHVTKMQHSIWRGGGVSNI